MQQLDPVLLGEFKASRMDLEVNATIYDLSAASGNNHSRKQRLRLELWMGSVA